MKSNKIGIKWKIFGYMAVFSAIILSLLWIFQIVLLTPFYRGIKIRQTESYAQTVAQNIDSEDLPELLRELTHQNSMCIRLISENGETVEDMDALPFCYIHNCSEKLLARYYQEAKENGGTMTRYFDSIDDFPRQFWEKSEGFVNPEDPALKQDQTGEEASGSPTGEGADNSGRVDKDGKNNRSVLEKGFPQNRGLGESIILGKLAQTSQGQEVLILVNAIIVPVNTTIETLRVQLGCITVIFIAISALVALILSKKISRPIIRINESAKRLAKGNYDTVFSSGGYREASELSDTLNYAAQELSKVETLRRELIANISHDLRTPLTMITGYSEVMRDIPGENTPENVQVIIDEANRLSALVNDILDISQLQAGVQAMTISRFNLTECIRQILSRYQKLKEQDGYRICFMQDADVWVAADEVKITQVVYNLINNAITYTGSDKSVAVTQSVRGENVRIEVTDTGDGIPEDQLNMIWDRYYKVDKAHKMAAIGTGLGLSIVRTVLDMHKAKYGVISAVGRGSTFWFELETAEGCEQKRK